MKCILFKHNWSEWQDYKSEKLTCAYTGFGIGMEVKDVGYMLIQMRRCADCKKVQLSNIKTK